MTTEVLRNMIYAASPTLEGLRYVVLDEVHYLQDPYRGPVWEEVIIHLPPDVGVVCLSATVSNAEEFADWVETVRGETAAVIEERRPVGLEHLYMVGEGSTTGPLLPTFAERGGEARPNPEAARLDAAAAGRRAGAAPAAGSGPRGGSRSSRSSRSGACCRRSRSYSAAPGAIRRSSSACRWAPAHTSDERPAIRRIAEAHTDALSDEDLEVLGTANGSPASRPASPRITPGWSPR